MSEHAVLQQDQQNSQPAKPNKSRFIGPVLMAVITVLAAVGLYLLQFVKYGLSGDPQDWAHFGAYIAGTAGVGLVASTLWALIITLQQQQHLLDQQQKSIELQKSMLSLQEAEMKLTRDELASTSRSNQQMAIYQSLDRLLPGFIDSFRNFVEPEQGSDCKGVVFDYDDYRKNHPLDDYWSDIFSDYPSRSSDYHHYFSIRLNMFYEKAAPLVEYCVQISKVDQNLKNYIYQSIFELKGFLSCIYAYSASTESERFEECMMFLLGLLNPNEIEYVASAVVWRKAVENGFQKELGSEKLCDKDGEVLDEEMILKRIEERDFSVF